MAKYVKVEYDDFTESIMNLVENSLEEVKIGTYEELGRDASVVRDTVFCIEQGISRELERDEFDKDSMHAVLYRNHVPVAAGRLLYQNGLDLIGRIATLKEYRSNGYGKKIVNALVKWGFDNGKLEIHLHSQKHAEDFYKNLGFESYGDVYF